MSGQCPLAAHKSSGWLMVAFFIGTIVTAPAMFGAGIPACVTDTLANYEAQGSCTMGVFTLKNFTFSNQAIAGSPTLVTDSQIMVNPTLSNFNSLNIQFVAPAGFHVNAGQSAEYIFQYFIDPNVLPIIDDEDIDLGPNDPVTLSGEFCGNGILSSGPKTVPVTCSGNIAATPIPGSLGISGPSADQQTRRFIFPTPVINEDVRLILDLDASSSPTGSDVGTFGSDTRVESGGPTIPEPSTSVFMLTGVLALSCLMAVKRFKLGRLG